MRTEVAKQIQKMLVRHFYVLRQNMTTMIKAVSPSAQTGWVKETKRVVDFVHDFSATTEGSSYSKHQSYADGVTFLKIIFACAILAYCAPFASANPLRPAVRSRQDLETALNNTKCDVREEIMDIRKFHPTIPPDVKLRPSCVKLRRCSGCCNNDRHTCMPTEIYITEIDVSRQHLTGNGGVDYITLNFTEHAQCACLSPLNPCIPVACSSDERWNVDSCQCESRCAEQECGPMQRWNKKNCRCECRHQCHPDRMMQLRFNQDSTTCVCACRRPHRSRSICKRRQAEFNPSSCTCIPSPHSRNRSKRG